MRVAYVMSRFPNLTETFVLYEIVALQRRGVRVEVYPLLRERQEVVHLEAQRIAQQARYRPFLSPAVALANLRELCARPRTYAATLIEVLRGTFGSLNFFVGALGIFPKTVLFAREMRQAGVEHVHAHFANHPALAALIVHRLTGIPFSFTAHGHDLHVERRMLGHKIRAARFAVAISEYNRRMMLAECPDVGDERLVLLHCGTDTDVFRPQAREGGRADRPFTLIALGALIEVKGHRILVEACRLLVERGLDVVAHVVGEGPLERDLRRQIEAAGLRERVRLLGPLAREAIVERVADADVIVQSSVPTARGSREGIPVSLMEGMSAGLPVVASRISGIPELVLDGETGLLVPPGDPRALADALFELGSDPERARRLGRAGRERVLAEFDLARNAATLERLFRGVRADERPASPPQVERVPEEAPA